MAQPFVSVLTPTYNRRKFIPAAIACFKAQTYPMNRMEWVILDDGTDKVKDLFDATGLTNVRYVALPDGEKLKIGAKRNRLNQIAKGEICVCMDDDDYYPPDRVKDAVTRLRSVANRKIPMVGASQLFLYYTDRNEIWTIGPYGQNHCTNGTMAYWRTYANDHKYDETVDKAEERSFLDDYKTAVAQLKPEDTMLVMCHSSNTFDKRLLLDTNNRNPTLRKYHVKINKLVKNKQLCEFYQTLKDDFAPKVDATPTPAIVVSEVSSPSAETATPTPHVHTSSCTGTHQ